MVTIVLIIITCFASWKAFENNRLLQSYSFSPYRINHDKAYYLFFTHAFIHGSWSHLLFNMMSLFFIGFSLESTVRELIPNAPTLFYTTLYFSAIPISSIYSFLKNRNNTSYSAVGASGAVSSVVFCLILLNPTTKFYVLAIPIGIPAYLFGLIYIASSIYMSRQNNDNIAHETHIGGALWGLLFPLLFDYRFIFSFFEQIVYSFK